MPSDGIVIPQWRKMIWEVLDLYPEFLAEREEMLYAYEHNISPKGAALVGRKIAEYLKDTIDFEEKENVFVSKSINADIAMFRQKYCSLEIVMYKDICSKEQA